MPESGENLRSNVVPVIVQSISTSSLWDEKES